jgi:hypothetical protein
MSPRRFPLQLTCELSPKEHQLVDQMKQACGVASDANLARVALWSLADHLDLPMPNGVFDLREHGGQNKKVARSPNPKIRQDAPPRSSARVQPKSHPWQEANRLIGMMRGLSMGRHAQAIDKLEKDLANGHD